MTIYGWGKLLVWISFGVFAASFVALGIWDLTLIYRDRLAGNSASRIILDIAREMPLFVFVIGAVLGVLIGHFLWPQIRPTGR